MKFIDRPRSHTSEPGPIGVNKIARLLTRRAWYNSQAERIFTFVFLMLALSSASFQAHAQVSAQLVGVVTDSSGAVLPGVTVTVTSLTSNQSFSAQTDERGRYSFLTIPQGSYRVSAEKASFKTLERTIELSVDQAANLNLVMAVGSTSEVVNVTASEAPLVNATDSTVGTVIEKKEIADLPLNGRNFASLITLSPGVSPTDISQGGAGPSIQGQRNRDNSYQADGVSIATVSFGEIVMTPPLDSVQEFRVQSVNGDAEFGGAGGGFVNLVTKSGTNRFSGSIYDYLRNSDLDARNTFQPTLPQYKQNQYGFSLGGPIFLPRIMPISHTKTYFFVSYEGLRVRQNQSSLGIVPTAAQVAGDFTGFNPIYNPFSTTPDPVKSGSYLRTQFPSNNIAGMINPTALAYAKAFLPAPNYSVAGSPYNFINTEPSQTNKDTWMGRIDHTFGDETRISVRWLQADSASGGTLPIQGHLFAGGAAYPRNLSIILNRTLTPTTLVTITYGYDRENNQTGNPIVADFYNSSGYNNPDGWPTQAGQPLVPGIGISGYNTYLPQSYQPEIVDSNAGTIDIQKILGKHTFKAGATLNHTFGSTTGLSYTESFNPQQTANLESPKGTGDGFASFLLGVPFNAGRLIGTTLTDLTGSFYGVYAEDTIHLTQHLSVDVGLRWDHAGRFDTNGTMGSFNQATGNSWLLTGPVNIPGVVFQGPNTGAGILNPVYTDFGPRAGFAYQLRSKLVIRAGYGLFYDTVAGRWQYIQNPRTAWPRALFEGTPALNTNTVQVSITNPFAGEANTVFLPNPFLTQTGAPAYPTGAQNNPDWLTPRVHEYNLAIEQQVSDNLVVSATYVGAVGHKLDCCGLINQAFTNGPTLYNVAARPFPMMGVFRTDQNKGYSDYNALELKIQQKFAHGITYLAGYTWSKSTDLACSGYIGAEGCQQTQPYNLKVDHGRSAFDLRQIANFSIVYQLPFGKGRMFPISNSVLDNIAGGWQTSAIFTLHTGLPMTAVLSNSNQTNIGGGVSPRPDLVGNPTLSNRTKAEFFNTAAFAIPSGYNYGTASRNIMTGPFNHGENISVFKDFSLFETRGSDVKLQYRADMFNAFNATVYGNPGVTLGIPSFGVISSASPGRIIQMALRVSF